MRLSFIFLAIIAAAFFFQMVSPQFESAFLFIPLFALEEPWRFVTSIFLHADMMHLFFNAYALFLFGSILEQRIKKKDYLVIFFGAGILGGLLYYIMSLTSFAPICSSPFGGTWPCPALGASGAVYGLLGAVAVMLPNMRIFMMFMPMKMKHAAMLWFALSFIGTFSSGDGIAHAGHLGGMIFGLAYAWWISREQKMEYDIPVYETWQD
ncbi:rhomboid family intramembrane serine protease [Candidatus Micrarchaeota archaeon]|nr:rhomboid family intramembrane serine protease [Candidatus Micrarchaeota archaeon]